MSECNRNSDRSPWRRFCHGNCNPRNSNPNHQQLFHSLVMRIISTQIRRCSRAGLGANAIAAVNNTLNICGVSRDLPMFISRVA